MDLKLRNKSDVTSLVTSSASQMWNANNINLQKMICDCFCSSFFLIQNNMNIIISGIGEFVQKVGGQFFYFWFSLIRFLFLINSVFSVFILINSVFPFYCILSIVVIDIYQNTTKNGLKHFLFVCVICYFRRTFSHGNINGQLNLFFLKLLFLKISMRGFWN